MAELDRKIEQAAIVLFEASEHQELKTIYGADDKPLNWHTLNKRNKEKYLKRAEEIVTQLLPLYEN